VYRNYGGVFHYWAKLSRCCWVKGIKMGMGLTWKKLLGEGLSNQQIETILLFGVVPIILLTIWFMVFLYSNLAPELES
jgi:hypothetical protein